MTFALVPPTGSTSRCFARATGLHPELVRRLVALGLLDVVRDAAGELWFLPAKWRPPTGSSGSAPACPSTTPPSASWSTCSTASPKLEAELRNRPRP